MPGSIVKFPVVPILGELIQITEGRMVYTYEHTDKRGSYIVAIPYLGKVEDVEMVPSSGEMQTESHEKPPPIFFGFVGKFLAEFWNIPNLKNLDWEWVPETGQMWCRFKDFDFLILERANQRLRAEVLRLKQELGRVPAMIPSAKIEPKKD